MTPAKEQAMSVIQSLPDDCTYDDIMYELYVRKKVEEGIKDADEGRTIPHEEVKKRFAK